MQNINLRVAYQSSAQHHLIVQILVLHNDEFTTLNLNFSRPQEKVESSSCSVCRIFIIFEAENLKKVSWRTKCSEKPDLSTVYWAYIAL
jgi:hypothetical protein